MGISRALSGISSAGAAEASFSKSWSSKSWNKGLHPPRDPTAEAPPPSPVGSRPATPVSGALVASSFATSAPGAEGGTSAKRKLGKAARKAAALWTGLSEAVPFESQDEEGEVVSALRRAFGAERFAQIPRDVLLRSVRSLQHASRRKGEAWDVSAAASIERVLEWRAASSIAQLAQQQPADVGRFDALWPWARCGCDEWGHPVVWDSLGTADWDGLLAEYGEERAVLLYFRRLERLRELKMRREAEYEHLVYKHVYVIDLSGLSLRMLKGANRSLIASCLGQVSSLYPETMLKMYLVNTPRLFPAMWRTVQPMIDPVSAAKISILGHLSNDAEQPARQELLGAGVDPAFLERLVRNGDRSGES